MSLAAEAPQLYRKRHLVPFGETIPLKTFTGWFINSVLAIPLADQAAGPAYQPPFAVAGQKLAVNICYEDVFGAELLAVARASTLLVNVTNDAWYGRSVAARQHNQISAMRALETGRPMLRATNTGITSAIAHDGRVLAELPVVHAGHSRDRDRRTRRRHALPALRRRARRGAGVRAAARGRRAGAPAHARRGRRRRRVIRHGNR